MCLKVSDMHGDDAGGLQDLLKKTNRFLNVRALYNYTMKTISTQ